MRLIPPTPVPDQMTRWRRLFRSGQATAAAAAARLAGRSAPGWAPTQVEDTAFAHTEWADTGWADTRSPDDEA